MSHNAGIFRQKAYTHQLFPFNQDGSGGCDGCLNWKGVGADTPNPNVEEDFYNFSPVNSTDNNGLEHLVEALEKIYTNIDWPFQVLKMVC